VIGAKTFPTDVVVTSSSSKTAHRLFMGHFIQGVCMQKRIKDEVFASFWRQNQGTRLIPNQPKIKLLTFTFQISKVNLLQKLDESLL
jgi:hypothetical protein